LPDGRNTHILQRDKEWWTRMLSKFFTVAKVLQSGKLLHVVVGPKTAKRKAA
jgi:predicted nucleic acid-binding protein